MERNEIKNKIFTYLKQQSELMSDPSTRPQIQLGFLNDLLKDEMEAVPTWQRSEILSIAREIMHELSNMGALYPGSFGGVTGSSSLHPWITITEYGKQIFQSESWLPYDPEGYVAELKNNIPDIDQVTLAYISESIAALNRRHLLSATLTLGVASENIMMLLIDAYVDWITDVPRKTALKGRIQDKYIFTQYTEFKKEFSVDVKTFPTELKRDWETYLEGVFNFIRLNRNKTGHPTGKKLDAKIVYANIQIFSDYAQYIFKLINHLT